MDVIVIQASTLSSVAGVTSQMTTGSCAAKGKAFLDAIYSRDPERIARAFCVLRVPKNKADRPAIFSCY
jgi:hypothetical protein